MASAVAGVSRIRSSPRLARWVDRFCGTSAPAAAERLAWPTLALVVGFVLFWRAALLALSLLFDRLGLVACGAGVPAPWKYSACWDTQSYQIIAATGYGYPAQPELLAFFPGYALLMDAANWLVPGSGDVKAGVLANVVVLAVAAVYVFRLVQLDLGATIAWRTLGFLLLFPSAFFFSAAYSEALFLLGLAGSLYHARRGQWLYAGLFGALASGTKLVGVVLLAALLVELLAQRRTSLRRWSSLGVLLAPLGALGYFAWLHWRYGDYGVFFDAQENWDRASFSPTFFMGVERLLGNTADAVKFYPPTITPSPTAWILIDTTLLLVFLVAGALLWRAVRPTYGALVLLGTLLLGLSGNPQSMNRYLVVLFPAFILLARLRSDIARDTLALLFGLGLMVETYFFVGAMWAG